MPKKEKPVLPGDIVQVVAPGHAKRGLLAIVTEVRSWGVGVEYQALRDGEPVGAYERFRRNEVHVCGTALILAPEVSRARAAADATNRLVEKEAGK